MIQLNQTWKKVFWGLTLAIPVLILLSFLLRIMLLFVLALVVGMVLGVLSLGKLRCPHCHKLLLQEALKVQLEGDVTCPKCEHTVTIC